MNKEQVNAKIDAAFAALRKQGFIARKNFQCCQSCAWSQLNADEKKMTEAKKAKIKGYVFYHHQDKDGMFPKTWHGERSIAFKSLCLAYDGANGRTQKEAGELVATAFRDAGFTVEWDGKPSTRIFIKP